MDEKQKQVAYVNRVKEAQNVKEGIISHYQDRERIQSLQDAVVSLVSKY